MGEHRIAILLTRLGLPHFQFSRHPGDGAFRPIFAWRRGNVPMMADFDDSLRASLERPSDLLLVEVCDMLLEAAAGRHLS